MYRIIGKLESIFGSILQGLTCKNENIELCCLGNCHHKLPLQDTNLCHV